MKCSQAQKLLERLIVQPEERVPIEADDIDILSRLGLVKVVDQQTYKALLEDAKRAKTLTREYGVEKEARTHYKDECSRIRKELIKVSGAIRKRKKARAASLRSELEKIELKIASTEVERLEKELNELRAQGKLIESLHPLGEAYGTITEKGNGVYTVLCQALPHHGSTDLETLLAERLRIWETIFTLKAKYVEARQYLYSKTFEPDSRLFHLAMSMAILPGSPEEVWSRGEVFNRYFKSKGWTSYNRLRIIAVLIRYTDDPTQTLGDFRNAFMTFIEGDFDACYATFWEAAHSMRTRTGTIEEHVRRCDDIRDALSKQGWSRTGTGAGYISCHLVGLDGEPDEITGKLRDWEKTLVRNADIDDCRSSAIAALTLMESPLSNEQKAERFANAREAIASHKWSRETDRYPVAAAIAAMPGSVEENAQLLHDTCMLLKGKNEFANKFAYTSRALILMSESYQTILRSDEARSQPSFYSSSDHHCLGPGKTLAGNVIRDPYVD